MKPEMKPNNNIGEWKNELQRAGMDTAGYIKSDSSSIKTLINLALVERWGEWSSYQDIEGLIKQRRAVEGDIDAVSLRNGMFQLINDFEKDETKEIEKNKLGKQVFFRLKERTEVQPNNEVSHKGTIISILDAEPVTSDEDSPTAMEVVAERLMRDRRMPFYGVYLPLRAVSKWVSYSEKTEAVSEEKRKYEGDECETLLGDWLSECQKQKPELCIIGLGIGEGVGEIEIIQRLLSEKYGFERIYYWAIDMNTHLLLEHTVRLENRFKAEIERKQLICGVIRGNFLNNFPFLLKTMRDKFKEVSYGPDFAFIPDKCPTLVSILGNVMGNLEHRASEWQYFESIRGGLEGHDLAYLLGVAFHKKGAPPEKYDLDDLFLTTPKYLTYELNILQSDSPDGEKAIPEFYLPKNKEESDGKFEVQSGNYQGAGQIDALIQGKIYEFLYTTRSKLSMTVKKSGVTLELPKGTKLLLYNIIKFDRDSLIKFLKSRGLEVRSQKERFHEVETNDGSRFYTVIASIQSTSIKTDF